MTSPDAYFEASFKQFYRVLAGMHSAIYSNDELTTAADLFVEFMNPRLPIDQQQNEQVWTERINNNRATVVDYLIQEKGMSPEEALLKAEEIKSFNAAKAEVTPTDANVDGLDLGEPEA